MDLITYALCRKLIKRSIEALGDIFTLKGNVASVDALPATGNNPGDIYLVGPSDTNTYDEYYWTSDGEWEMMGATITFDGLITEEALYKGEDGTGTVEEPAEDTILYIVNNHSSAGYALDATGTDSFLLPTDNEYIPIEDTNNIAALEACKEAILEGKPIALSILSEYRNYLRTNQLEILEAIETGLPGESERGLDIHGKINRQGESYSFTISYNPDSWGSEGGWTWLSNSIEEPDYGDAVSYTLSKNQTDLFDFNMEEEDEPETITDDINVSTLEACREAILEGKSVLLSVSKEIQGMLRTYQLTPVYSRETDDEGFYIEGSCGTYERFRIDYSEENGWTWKTYEEQIGETYQDFTGATSLEDGTQGLVPAPTTSDIGKYLKADGTWAEIPQGPTIVTNINSSSTDSQVPSAKCVYDAINALPEPMVFKGTLGSDGTVANLPVDGTANIGDTYKVATAGTYAGQIAKVGDTFICLTKTSNTNTWELIPSGDEPTENATEGYYYNGVFYADANHTQVIPAKTGEIYIDLSSNKTYRYDSQQSSYVEIGSTLSDAITADEINQIFIN